MDDECEGSYTAVEEQGEEDEEVTGDFIATAVPGVRLRACFVGIGHRGGLEFVAHDGWVLSSCLDDEVNMVEPECDVKSTTTVILSLYDNGGSVEMFKS